jgi:hypothetical protein
MSNKLELDYYLIAKEVYNKFKEQYNNKTFWLDYIIPFDDLPMNIQEYWVFVVKTSIKLGAKNDNL